MSTLDYWILRFCRDTAAIILFVVAPIVQVSFSRWLPLAIILAFAFLVLGHVLTLFRHLPEAYRNTINIPSLYRQTFVRLALAYLAFVAWAALSMQWSAVHSGGVSDIALLCAAPILALILAQECARSILFRFETFVIFGFVVTCVFLICELLGLTNFHLAFELVDGGLHDLNRNVVYLSLLIIPILFICVRDSGRPYLVGVCVALWLVVALLSLSESAKLMGVISLAVFVVMRRHRRLFPIIALATVASLAVLPFVLSPLNDAVVQLKKNGLAPKSGADRVQIWIAYKEKIDQKPIAGWGLRAHRQFAEDQSEVESKIKHSHPHNLAIQLWTDVGAIGVVLFMAFLGLLCRLIGQLPTNLMAASASLMIGSYSHFMTGAEAFQGWWIGAIAMSCIALMGSVRSDALKANEI